MPQSIENTKCKDCKWCRMVKPTQIRGVTVDAMCDSRWGASSNIKSQMTTYQNIVTFGAREDKLGYEPAGHPEWAKVLRDTGKTCFQDKQDQRPGELLHDAS